LVVIRYFSLKHEQDWHSAFCGIDHLVCKTHLVSGFVAETAKYSVNPALRPAFKDSEKVAKSNDKKLSPLFGSHEIPGSQPVRHTLNQH
jgi:Uri superfamily endonuclease